MPEKTILIIDDDPLVPKILTPFLTKQGYKVATVSDGEAAVGAVKELLPDLIILDVQMPKMNGYTFLFELKKIPTAEKIPIIVLTAKQGMAEIFKFEGVKEYVHKPVNNEQLLNYIQQYLK